MVKLGAAALSARCFRRVNCPVSFPEFSGFAPQLPTRNPDKHEKNQS